MDQRKLMDNANTITDMAKVRRGANEGNCPLVKLDGILQQHMEGIEGDIYISKLSWLLR